MTEIRADMERLEAAAFRRLLEHLDDRHDAANIDLMGLAGFCRNCLADWLAEASEETDTPLTRDAARAYVYGEPYEAYKQRQPKATPEQIAKMEQSLQLNEERRRERAARKG